MIGLQQIYTYALKNEYGKTPFHDNNGLNEMAANAVEIVVDERCAIAYAVYLSRESSIGAIVPNKL